MRVHYRYAWIAAITAAAGLATSCCGSREAGDVRELVWQEISQRLGDATSKAIPGRTPFAGDADASRIYRKNYELGFMYGLMGVVYPARGQGMSPSERGWSDGHAAGWLEGEAIRSGSVQR